MEREEIEETLRLRRRLVEEMNCLPSLLETQLTDAAWEQDNTSKAAAALGKLGGKAGTGEAKRRGDSAYYKALRAKGWEAQQARQAARMATEHREADAACGRSWQCACAACRNARG